MPDVGTFRTTILIESVERRGETRAVENALVDTGSEFTWVPRPVLEELGIRPERLQRFLVADGRAVERPLGIGIVHAAGTSAPDFVVFAEPDDIVILGAVTRGYEPASRCTAQAARKRRTYARRGWHRVTLGAL